MYLKALSVVLLASGSLTACANFKPPAIDYDNDPTPAVLAGDPPRPVKVVALPKLLPLPGQLKPLPGQLKPLPAGKPAPEPKDPAVRVAKANEAARIQPTRNGYINAVQVYPFSDGALYRVYTAPGQVTDIALQESEQLVGSGPIAARGIIGDTESGTGASKKVHILAKPDAAGACHQSRHQHRPADLSSRTQIDGKDLYGVGLLAISSGSAHCAAPAERRGRSGFTNPEWRRHFPTAVSLRDRGR